MVGCCPCVVVSILTTHDYGAHAVFLPTSIGAAASRTGGLAAELGLPVGSASAGDPPALYVTLVKSRRLLEAVAETPFPDPERGRAGTLTEILALDDDPQTSLTATVGWLRNHLRVVPDPTSGLIQLDVEAESAVLAEAINRRILTLINDFNLARRQEGAAANRAFIDSRVAEAKRNLDAAEGALRRFLDVNRRIEDSPTLIFERDRLQRNVVFQQQIYTNLATSLEQAKIEEVRNTPVVTVVDGPEGSGTTTGAGPLVVGAAGLIVGFVLSLTVVLVLEFANHLRTNRPEEIQALRQAWDGTGDRR